MTNYIKIIQGLMFFIIMCFVSIIIYLIGTNMLLATTGATDPFALDTTEQAIIWLGMIIIWVLILVILPAHFIIEGLREE